MKRLVLLVAFAVLAGDPGWAQSPKPCEVLLAEERMRKADLQLYREWLEQQLAEVKVMVNLQAADLAKAKKP